MVHIFIFGAFFCLSLYEMSNFILILRKKSDFMVQLIIESVSFVTFINTNLNCGAFCLLHLKKPPAESF